ncbi:hypothetical protein QO010_004511 [Caulobacter ginsengisoli]|uniref:Uncharacterized protein n=1 Tax=Caulobacter ginsengisoli TaxID=400775 RepID=A0ABU0IXJ8_9CAUL|nr:hypothetical protein [Caulobacter ginsengisoli]MDQ0466715.1 hypothetical protein [Caulobacter ginsengisoli]
MRILTTALLVAASAASLATAAYAEAARFNDAQFIKAARCRGLAGAPGLGGDKAAFDAVLKAQRQGRETYTRDRADAARSDAEHQARNASDAEKQALSAELSGACAALLS